MTTENLQQQVHIWAASCTDANSKRYDDLFRDKVKALIGNNPKARVAGFFAFSGKLPEAVNTIDIEQWAAAMQAANLAETTIYARVSRVSSFFDWLIEQGHTTHNPAHDARPQAPQAYQREKVRPLTQQQVDTLLATVLDQAQNSKSGAVSGKRDYALLQFYFATGKKRSEIINLRWSDINMTDDAVQLLTDDPPLTVPGGRAALVAYLKASNRWDLATNTPTLKPTSPLWLRHDRAAKGQQAVTSHGFVYMLKKYARMAGMTHIHLNQTRHTAALRVSQQAESLSEAQQRLGYQSRSMTQIYLKNLQQHTPQHDTD